PLRMELVDRIFEEPLVIHVGFPILRRIIVIGLCCVHRAPPVKMPRPGPVPNDAGSWPIPGCLKQICFSTMPRTGGTVTDLTFREADAYRPKVHSGFGTCIKQNLERVVLIHFDATRF
ncbi:hypothetical protein, partial [Mesorhizobium sp.]|uniref:hypothetical protein n=1 Tax=Mesorhizobium sp. TaxID=1871066 RepID=UPI0025B7F879